jgi:PAS domain S-box-containing protein
VTTGEDDTLDVLLAASVDGVLAFDRELRYTRWSPAMERISGVPAAAALGAHALTLFPFLQAIGEDRAFHAALAGEVVSTWRRPFTTLTGRAGYFDGHYRPLRDAGGAVVGGIAVIREVTDTVELAEQRSSLSAARRALALGDQRLAVALEAAHLGPWEWDAASDLVTVSETAAAIFGIPTEPRLTWAAMRELLHPADREPARVAVEAAVAGRTDYDIEYRVALAGGGERWVAATGRATYRADGTPERMLGVVQDITARKLAEQALVEESRALDALDRTWQLLAGELDLERLLQALTDVATQISDAAFGSFFYNVVEGSGGSYTLYTLSGVDRAAFAGFPMPRATAVFAPTFAGSGIVRSDDITKDPRYGHSEPYRGMPPGHLPVRSYLAVPVAARSGEVLGGLFFGHERTGVFTARHERLLAGIAAQAAIAIDNARLYQTARNAEQEAEARALALAEADRRKDDFLAVLAHELRNPLGAVSNAIAVLQLAAPGSREFARALAVAVRQVDHQRKLIDDLLDMSRVSRGKIELQLEPVDLAAIVRDATEDQRPALTAADLALDVALPANPVTVVGDRVRLAQVVGNLLDNARKFTPAGGRIEVRLELAATGEAVVTVSDTGIGIEAALLPRLFDPFMQVRRPHGHGLGGLGLGLSVVKGLVGLHPGGRVEAESAGPGTGARFRIALPLAAATAVEAVAPTRDLRRPGAGRHVLVVEDLPEASETLRDVLTILGCTVEIAADGRAALAALAGARPDLVLCDIGLPGEMSGLDLARVIRRDPAHAGVRLVALTGYGTAGDRRASSDAGFDAHLTKPIEMKRIAQLLAELPRHTDAGG